MNIFTLTKKIPLFFILTTVFLFSGCNNFASIKDGNFSLFSTEKVLITLPEYPADTHPELAGWLVKTRLNGKTEYLQIEPNEKVIEVNLQKNKASPVLVWPVISEEKTDSRIIFFHPAGCIYPYNTKATWNAGFSSHILDTLIEQTVEINISDKIDFLSRFNWNKLQANIEEKEKKALSKNENFNPWHLNKEIILKAISSGNFSSHQIKEKDKINIQINLDNQNQNIYSKYVPINVTKINQTDKDVSFEATVTFSKDKYTTNPENQFLQNNYLIEVIIVNKKSKPRLAITELARYTKTDETK